MSRTDAERISDALDHLAVLRRHLARHDLHDETVIDAVALRLGASIEALANGGTSLGQQIFGDAWRQIWSVRNRIAHGYAYINIGIITATIQDDLPAFESALREELLRLQRD